MKRLTNKDWHTTKFMGLNDREVLHRLWELENLLETHILIEKDRTAKFKNGDTIFYIKTKGYGATVEEARELIIETDKVARVCIRKTKITYYLKHKRNGIDENRLYETEEEATERLNYLKEKKDNE